MTKSFLKGALGLALLLAVTVSLRAEEAKHPKAYVVVVGISEYADKQIKPRPHAEADAKALYDLFTNKAYLGVNSGNIRLLLGSADSKRQSTLATHENILKSLQWLSEKAGKDDLAIFAFIGQGAPLGDRACYLATDSTFKDRSKNGVAAAEVEHDLENIKSQKFCVFLDVNFRGFDSGKDPAPELNLENAYKEYLGNEEHSPVGRIIFLATDGRSQSLDLKDHGVFSKVILDGLAGKADKEGYEPDGLVTVDELAEYMEKELPLLVRKNGKTKEEKEQSAHALGGRLSHFVLTQNPAVTASVKSRLQKLKKLAEDQTISKEVAEEGKELLSRMPKLETYRSLRKDYQKLVDGMMSAEEFKKDRDQLLDSMKINTSVAEEYADKVLRAVQQVKDSYIKNLNEGEMVAWAIRGLFQRLEEKIPQDIKDRLDNAKNMKVEDLKTLLADARQKLGNREDLEHHKDLDYALQRMLSHLDPYTTYIDPETLLRWQVETSGNFTGIGIQIRKDAARDVLAVVTPIKGSPAYKAGIKAGDVITTITREVDSNGKKLDPAEVLDTKGMLLSDAVKKILGKAKTKVKLTVEREGEAKPLEFEITRGLVEVETVLGIKRKDNDSWDYMIDPESKIAYIRLTSFARNTSRDLAKALNAMSDQGIKGFILDLRFNPGGLLSSAVEISDMFIDDGLIVTIKPRVGRENVYNGEHEGSYLNFPMVCLVNGGSASGSEIVSACLQDHKRAIIMGERSYGKGSVQNIQPFEDGELKMTVASFWRPNGKNLNKASTAGKDENEWGVTPDKGYLLKLTPKDRFDLMEHQRNSEIIARHDMPAKETEAKAAFKDGQLDMALNYLRNQIKTASRASLKKAG